MRNTENPPQIFLPFRTEGTRPAPTTSSGCQEFFKMTYAQTPNLPDVSQVTSMSLQIIPTQAQTDIDIHRATPDSSPWEPPAEPCRVLTPLPSVEILCLHLMGSQCASVFCTPKPALVPLPRLALTLGLSMRFICMCDCFLCHCWLPKGKTQVPMLSPAWCGGHRCLPPCISPCQRALGNQQLSHLPEALSPEAMWQ